MMQQQHQLLLALREQPSMLLVWQAKLDKCFFHFGCIERPLCHLRHRRHPPRRPPGGCPAPAPSPLPAITCYAKARCQRAPAPGCSCGGDDLENREKIEVVVSPSPCYCFAGRARPLRGRAAGLVAESGGWRRRPALPHDSHTTHVMKSNSSTHTRNRTRPSCERLAHVLSHRLPACRSEGGSPVMMPRK